MNKFLKATGCILISGTLLLATACGKKSVSLDTERRALNLAIGALDGNFNPFFYTSANDGEVIGMTQASLLGVDPSGNPAVGDNYPVVAQDYKTTYYTEIKGGSKTSDSTEAARTEYEFLIKNGMKFSDGTPLTIQDVLFNFYVYLDPAYTGSNTMYSVDIQGLAAYQANDSTIGVDGKIDSSGYAADAQSKIDAIVNWSSDSANYPEPSREDIELVDSLFKEELSSDWTSIETSWQTTYETNYSFKYAWQAYLFQEGYAEVQIHNNDDGTSYEIRVDENGNEVSPTNKDAYDKAKNLTTLDPWSPNATVGQTGITARQAIIDEINGATTESKISEYLTNNNLSDSAEDKEYAYLQITKNICVDAVYNDTVVSDPNSNLYGYGFAKVLTLWATASTAYSAFLANARGEAIKNSQNPMYYISGIQTYKTTSFEGKNGSYTGEYDVLKIVINGVDPAAIWSFGISIAPIHYYSGSYGGVDYYERATGYQNGGVVSSDDNGEDRFGVKRGDFNFFERVIKGTSSGKSTLPKGAGAYVASTQSGSLANSGNDFEKNNIVYFQRNENFHTMGANIENAKIKYLQYKVLADDRIIPSLESGAIDYGEPTATTDNLLRVQKMSSFTNVNYDTNGYGYVGVNPTYVPDVEIRRLIMRSMDAAKSVNYYGSLAKPINRPMSSTSWAYPKGCTRYEGLEPLDSKGIEDKLRELGYEYSGGVWHDKWGKACSYTFTIAGATSDHPAYRMFVEAAEILNQAGFKIKVSTSANALKDLAQGKLAVWAAAYSTGIDPDMYQVYHKDSQATSILNWGYKTILNDSTGKYTYELNKINDLSDAIEDARKTLDQEDRKYYYEQCLNYVMDLAIQLPIYQRKDLCVFNNKVIKESSVNVKNPNHINGVLDRIWEVEYV